MPTTPITIEAGDRAPSAAPTFGFRSLRLFSAIPRGFEVVPMHGIAIIFDPATRYRPIEQGRLYVRESQTPPANMSWERWLAEEDRYRRERATPRPRSMLRIRREVVQAIVMPIAGGFGFRLDNGQTDGPYEPEYYGSDIIGEVVGIHQPRAGA